MLSRSHVCEVSYIIYFVQDSLLFIRHLVKDASKKYKLSNLIQ